LHKSFEGKDYALRLNAPVVSGADKVTVLDMKGNSNLCAVCHQTRTAEPNKTNPGENFRITNSYYGPHYGTQANILAGVGLAEIPGEVAYPAANSAKHLTMNGGSCVGCHMAPFSKKSGGHSFNPNLDACNKCHNATNTDFNYGGVQTEVESQLVVLRDKLILLGVVEGDDEHGYHPVVGTYPMIQAQAYFNWIGLAEDRSLGAHNPKYVKALLQNTIKALE
jgi:cytochrome c2